MVWNFDISLLTQFKQTAQKWYILCDLSLTWRSWYLPIFRMTFQKEFKESILFTLYHAAQSLVKKWATHSCFFVIFYFCVHQGILCRQFSCEDFRTHLPLKLMYFFFLLFIYQMLIWLIQLMHWWIFHKLSTLKGCLVS